MLHPRSGGLKQRFGAIARAVRALLAFRQRTKACWGGGHDFRPFDDACRRLWSLARIAPADLGAQPKAKPTLDYDFYKGRVEPIFLKKKAGHTRCVVCHSESNNFLKLEPLSPGAKTWTDEQSRKNFETVSKLVNPGEPMVSRLLMHPLAPEGGGDVFHSGGRQFMSVNDPDWKTMAAFVNGATLGGRSKKN